MESINPCSFDRLIEALFSKFKTRNDLPWLDDRHSEKILTIKDLYEDKSSYTVELEVDEDRNYTFTIYKDGECIEKFNDSTLFKLRTIAHRNKITFFKAYSDYLMDYRRCEICGNLYQIRRMLAKTCNTLICPDCICKGFGGYNAEDKD